MELYVIICNYMEYGIIASPLLILFDPAKHSQKIPDLAAITPGSGHKARPESQPADWPRECAAAKIQG